MRTPLAAAAMLVVTLAAAYAVAGDRTPQPAGPRWEYLVVAGGRTNLQPTGSDTLRKVNMPSFEHENYPLEMNMDKLGSAGWELVSVGGGPGEPVYYFKRPK